ncbi:unnamed protein product [Caenorhabditis angaria]|uniref:protein disulfide-isomerase n=1 Tax=Caenorhabditis angaria TaxID=860376 RepID=A0A9P1IQ59_9PELO|nr:unnamed protein product [Caenorhabditis angaria]
MQLYISLLVVNLIAFSNQKNIKNEKCRTCNFLIATFEEGLKNTARNHFAGGDTAWEEKNLGKYKTSETRLIEVLEGVCKKSTISNIDKFHGISDLEFKCASLVENYEEQVEEFYYNHQSKNASIWFCVEQLNLCCPHGHFGKTCEKCPGLAEGADACFGNGACHGDGSREGNGKCKCEDGYSGNLCRHCETDYYEEKKRETSINCKKCHESCQGGCKDETPKSCSKCKNGWILDENQECVDVNECENTETCTKCSEKCVNEIGSYRCECLEGYKRDEQQNCILDVEASPADMLIRPAQFLRFVAMSALVFIITFVVWYRSTLLYVLCALATIALILVDLYINPNTIPDEAKPQKKLDEINSQIEEDEDEAEEKDEL